MLGRIHELMNIEAILGLVLVEQLKGLLVVEDGGGHRDV